MQNYRNKDASHQDHVIVKAFKKQLLITRPATEFCHGYIPVWAKRSRKSVIDHFEYTHKDGFVIPRAGAVSFRSILNTIRREKPLLGYEYKDQEGNAIIKPISDLTEAELVRSLKKLSLILYSAEDEKKWLHFGPAGEANIILLADQLKAEGRLGRIPLKILLNKYVSSIFRGYGKEGINHDMINFEKQLLSEHRIPIADVDAIYGKALSLVAILRNKDPEITKEYKESQKASMRAMIQALCDDIQTGKRSRVLSAPPVIKDHTLPGEMNLVELRMKRDQEALDIIKQAGKLLHDPRRTQVIMDGVAIKRDQLIREYNYTGEQAELAIRGALWKLQFPNSK